MALYASATLENCLSDPVLSQKTGTFWQSQEYLTGVLGMVGACVETPATRFAALPVDDTLSPMLSLRVAYWRPHRVPRRVLLVRVGGAKNGRLVEPLCHNLQTNGQLVPGEAAGDGYSGNTG